uniref:Uncharacterized protein n=1 Tax=Timema monikensis TaxID=170555 RepID=A0A7R9E950_9NEOP|nr:unnamed protein product [Timema monikensis]
MSSVAGLVAVKDRSSNLGREMQQTACNVYSYPQPQPLHANVLYRRTPFKWGTFTPEPPHLDPTGIRTKFFKTVRSPHEVRRTLHQWSRRQNVKLVSTDLTGRLGLLYRPGVLRPAMIIMSKCHVHNGRLDCCKLCNAMQRLLLAIASFQIPQPSATLEGAVILQTIQYKIKLLVKNDPQHGKNPGYSRVVENLRVDANVPGGTTLVYACEIIKTLCPTTTCIALYSSDQRETSPEYVWEIINTLRPTTTCIMLYSSDQRETSREYVWEIINTSPTTTCIMLYSSDQRETSREYVWEIINTLCPTATCIALYSSDQRETSREYVWEIINTSPTTTCIALYSSYREGGGDASVFAWMEEGILLGISIFS